MLGLPNGIPSHDTFGRVFARLDAEQFEACSVKWEQHLHELTQGQLLAIDGKTVRRSHARRQKKGPLHLISAWATTSRLVLGQTEVAADGNEITAIPELLEMLELSGCIVSIDHGHAQHNLAILHRLALNLLSREKSAKIGMAAKRKRAGRKTDYLLKVLSQ